MRIALVLGSGGARGWAHIGAIQEILARGHEVVGISGASIGALVGGVHAAGKLDELGEWVGGLTRPEVRRLYDVTLTGPGLLKGRKVLAEIEKLTGPVLIEELPIPYTAVAADIVSNREVWFQSGSLYLAVRASIAMPTFFTPVLIGEHLLADGGLLNPLPVEPTLPIDSDATIAVDLSGPPLAEPRSLLRERIEKDQGPVLRRAASSVQQGVERASRSLADTEFFQRLDQAWSRDAGPGGTQGGPGLPDDLREDGRPVDTDDSPAAAPGSGGEGPAETERADIRASPLPSGLRTMEVIDLSISTMQRIIARYRAAANPVTATVQLPRDVAGTLDFHEGRRLIDLGRERTAQTLDDVGM